MRKALTILFILLCINTITKAQNNFWYGSLNFNGVTSLIITLKSDNTLDTKDVKAWMGSPMQTSIDIPIDILTVNNDSISFSVTKLGVTFTGIINGINGNITGTFTQRGTDFPLTLTKSDKPFQIRRPQTPQPPYPYEVTEVTIPSTGSVKLSATITSPKSNQKEKFPAVILVAGSGPMDRDETVFMHKPFLVIADYLTRNGYIVLRYDKRGIGKSTGNYAEATTFDFADDANAAFEFLKQYPNVDINKTGIIGHSEGGMIAPIIADRNSGVNFIILLAGPAESIYNLMMNQNRYAYTSNGVPNNIKENAMNVVETMLESLSKGTDQKTFEEETVNAMTICQQSLSAEDYDKTGFPKTEADMINYAKQLTSPWFKTFMQIQPETYLKNIKIPVLGIYAQKDVQVYWEDNYPILNNILTNNKNIYSKTIKFDNLNHMFQPTSNGSPSEYGIIETTIAPEVLTEIGSFMKTMKDAKKLDKYRK